MNPKEFEEWLERIRNILVSDGEEEGFIEHAMTWYSSFKYRDERYLIQTYHPTLAGASDEVVYEFVSNARYPLFEGSDKDFKRQSFDSCFFLYRAMLKMEYLDKK